MEILKIHNNPERAEWAALTERFTREEEEITRQVTEILADVKSGGDRSLREVTRRVEGRDPRTFEIPADVRAAAAALIPAALKEALAAAKANIETFHRAQLPPEVDIETMPGVRCVQRAVPIRRVGLYIPGGKAPLFSTVLMLAVPARVAGCGEVILCTPARPDGTIAPEILYAADLCGVDRIFSVGGAQAVAAMAYGTESIPRVDKIVGPGNAYVAAAKRKVFGRVGIDMIAGPSEILVICDGKTDPDWIAMDLFSQAEHDVLAQAVLLTPDAAFADAVEASMDRQIEAMPRKDIIRQSLANRGAIIVTRDLEEACRIADTIAPEHLEMSTDDPEKWAELIHHAGAIFLGRYSSEALGDYCAGPNHVLPTSRTARFSSPLGVYDFQKRTSMIYVQQQGVTPLARIAECLGKGESLYAHAASAHYRIQDEK